MQDDNKYNSFFSDLNDNLIKILLALVSVFSILPFFLKQATEVTGLAYKWGYAVFLLLYFILPIVFLFCYNKYIKDTSIIPANQKKWKQYSFIPVIIICTGYLYFPLDEGAVVIFIIIILTISIRLMILTYERLKEVNIGVRSISGISGKNETEKMRNTLRSIAIEYVVIAIFLTLGLMSVTYSKWEHRKYKFNDQHQCLRDLDTLTKVRNTLLDQPSDNLDAALYRYQAAEISTDSLQNNSARLDHWKNLYTMFDNNLSKIDSLNYKNLNKNARYILSIQQGEEYNHYLTARSFDICCKLLYNHINSSVRKELSTMIGSLQLRSSIILYVTFLFLLYRWIIFSTALINDRLTQALGVEWAEIEEHKKKSADGKDLMKKGIWLLALMILPFYKTVDEKSIDIDKPFLNFSLQSLWDGKEVKEDRFIQPLHYGNTYYNITDSSKVDSPSRRPDNDTLQLLLGNLRKIIALQEMSADLILKDPDFKKIKAIVNKPISSYTP